MLPLAEGRVLARLASHRPKMCRSSSGFIGRIGGWKKYQGGVTWKGWLYLELCALPLVWSRIDSANEGLALSVADIWSLGVGVPLSATVQPHARCRGWGAGPAAWAGTWGGDPILVFKQHWSLQLWRAILLLSTSRFTKILLGEI